MFRRLYEWTLSRSRRGPPRPMRSAPVSFSESSFFPVPPDVMLVPMALARPDRAWFYALVCTLPRWSGGLLGYSIGWAPLRLHRRLAVPALRTGEGAEAFRRAYAEYGHWVILLKGLTPIPYKLVTITSGFAGYDLFWFTSLSILTRGARFFIIALLMSQFGPQSRSIIDHNFNLVAGWAIAAFVGGFVAFRYLF